METIHNLTPHVVRVIGPDGACVRELASVGLARVAVTATAAGTADGLPLVRQTYGQVEGLPDAQPGTWLVVSSLVRAACPARHDLLSPGDLVRGPDGQPVGCRNFART